MKMTLFKLSAIMIMTFNSFVAFAGEPVVVVYVIDGIQLDAATTAAANGASNIKFIMDHGVYVRETYCTSPAPRMYLPDGTLPWGTSSSPNVAMHTGTHIFESRQMDDIFLSARRGNIKSVFAGGAVNYKEFTTPDFCYAGSLSDSAVVGYGIKHFKNDGVRLLRLHLQQIRESWSGPEEKLDPDSKYQKAILKADALLGELIQALKEANVWEDTYIIIAGDHGMGVTSLSDHPPSVISSWSPLICFYGPGIKKGKAIPYAEIPDIAIMINHFLKLKPLNGHTDPEVPSYLRGTTGIFLQNIFEGTPDEIAHPQFIKWYLIRKNQKPSDDYAEYRSAMITFITGRQRGV
ncbi:MAG: sulfatase-like hydrolase/transferase [Bacteroidales bacterium]|nr:sulfatase-like hydrolase/transferase [Bacteroidales bacterium]